MAGEIEREEEDNTEGSDEPTDSATDWDEQERRRFLYLVVFSNANGSAVCKIKNKHQFSKIVLTLNR